MAKSKKTNRRNRYTAVAIGAVTVLAVATVLVWLLHKKPGQVTQSAACPDVMLVSIPGTWESSPQQDPLNPTQFPNALLLNVTRPLADQFKDGRLQIYTVPYTAQFHRPLSNDDEKSYNDSRREGTEVTKRAIADMHAKCPLTNYMIVGFSQGAVIGGDIASDIGNGKGPVDENLVRGVTLIADGRRQPGVGVDIGPNPPGEGAEVTLQGVPFIPSDMTMTGPRVGGFGALNDRTNQICAQGDLICAAPSDAFNLLNLPKTLQVLMGGAGEPVHAMYNTTRYWNFGGVPATLWTRDWAANVIENAPRPAHG